MKSNAYCKRVSVCVQQLSNKRLWTGIDGMQIFRLGKHVRCAVWPYRSNLGVSRHPWVSLPPDTPPKRVAKQG